MFPELSAPVLILVQVVAAVAMITSAQFAGVLFYFSCKHIFRRGRSQRSLPSLLLSGVGVLCALALLTWPALAQANLFGVRALPVWWTVAFTVSGWALPAGWAFFDSRFGDGTHQYEPRHAQVAV